MAVQLVMDFAAQSAKKAEFAYNIRTKLKPFREIISALSIASNKIRKSEQNYNSDFGMGDDVISKNADRAVQDLSRLYDQIQRRKLAANGGRA